MSRLLLIVFSVFCLGSVFCLPLVWAEESDGAEVLLLKNRYYPHKILKLIRESKESVRLCLVVCDYTGNRADFSTRLIQELASQARHGVVVEVILEGGEGKLGKANAKASQFLYDNGVAVYEDSETEFTRSNMLIVDQFTAIVGSTVWAKKSLSQYNELNLWIESREFSETLLKRFNKIKQAGKAFQQK